MSVANDKKQIASILEEMEDIRRNCRRSPPNSIFSSKAGSLWHDAAFGTVALSLSMKGRTFIFSPIAGSCNGEGNYRSSPVSLHRPLIGEVETVPCPA